MKTYLDLNYDLYKHVPKIKYTDQTISPSEIKALMYKKEQQEQTARRQIWHELHL